MTTSRDNTPPINQRLADLSTRCESLTLSASNTVGFFEAKLETNGSYGKEAKDISAYFKSPMMFIAANNPESARRMLNYIKDNFMQPNGDFSNDEHSKSIKPEYIEYWSYVNGWILRAANMLDMADISKPAYQYLTQFHAGKNAGFITANIKDDQSAEIACWFLDIAKNLNDFKKS